MGHIAAVTTHVAASATDTAVQGGDSIIVYGVVVEGTAAAVGQVRLEDSAGVLLMLLSVGAEGSVIMDIPFRADAGLQVTTPALITCTVLHSQSGG